MSRSGLSKKPAYSVTEELRLAGANSGVKKSLGGQVLYKVSKIEVSPGIKKNGNENLTTEKVDVLGILRFDNGFPDIVPIKDVKLGSEEIKKLKEMLRGEPGIHPDTPINLIY